MIRVNDFLADFEAHHAPPSNLKYQTAPHARVFGEFPRTLIASKPLLVSDRSLASYLANGQGLPQIGAVQDQGFSWKSVRFWQGFNSSSVFFTSAALWSL